MKIANIKFHGMAYDGERLLGSRFFATEETMSKWANKWYRKNENATVIIYEGMTDKVYCTYHA